MLFKSITLTSVDVFITLQSSFLYELLEIYTSHFLSIKRIIDTYLFQRFSLSIISNLIHKCKFYSQFSFIYMKRKMKKGNDCYLEGRIFLTILIKQRSIHKAISVVPTLNKVCILAICVIIKFGVKLYTKVIKGVVNTMIVKIKVPKRLRSK